MPATCAVVVPQADAGPVTGVARASRGSGSSRLRHRGATVVPGASAAAAAAREAVARGRGALRGRPVRGWPVVDRVPGLPGSGALRRRRPAIGRRGRGIARGALVEGPGQACPPAEPALQVRLLLRPHVINQLIDDLWALLLLIFTSLDGSALILAVLQQLREREHLPDQHLLDSFKALCPVHASLIWKSQILCVLDLQFMVSHLLVDGVAIDNLSDLVDISDALSLKATGLPSSHAILEEELVDEHCSLLVLIFGLQDSACALLQALHLALQLPQGCRLPSQDLLQHLLEFGPLHALLQRQAGACVPLTQLNRAHPLNPLVDCQALNQQLLQRLVIIARSRFDWQHIELSVLLPQL
mmetsp:Transcript_45838/g.130871  ORF Transcript_45838/g.130871 Transcript_45838/m.130871 type:complete len:357 (-) Transcript_45838:2341-3411(-)